VLMLASTTSSTSTTRRGPGRRTSCSCDRASAALFACATADIVARLGGDEFALLLPGGDGRRHRVSPKRCLRSYATEAHPPATSPYLGLIARADGWTVSIGIARFEDVSAWTSEEMMSNADLATVRSQGRRRGRWARYRSGRDARPEEREQHQVG